jgi:hypothetical protein
LPEADPLSDIFPHPEPAKRTLHIVMRAPPIGEYSLSVEPLSITHRFHSVPHTSTSLDYPILELNCFVHDDDPRPRHVFPVKIARTESVGTLKEAIKDKKQVALEHVDADALQLWNVSIIVDDGFKENVSKVELRDEEELSPVKKLSALDEPHDGHLHIIVSCPPPNSECEYFVESGESDHFCVGIVRSLQTIAPARRNPLKRNKKS